MLPEFLAAPALRDRRLVRVLPGCRPLGGSVYALYPKDRQRSLKIRALLAHLGKVLAPSPPWQLKD